MKLEQMVDPVPQPAYIFWIYYIEKKRWFFGYQIANKKLVKCAINNLSIMTYESWKEGKSPLYIPLATISNCRYGSLHDTSPHSAVFIQTNDMKSIDLVPVNPFDPSSWFHHNEGETRAMWEVINLLQNNKETKYVTNPYLRQLKDRDTPKLIFELSENWIEDISPWIYYRKYQAVNENKGRKQKFILDIIIYTSLLAVIIYGLWKLYF